MGIVVKEVQVNQVSHFHHFPPRFPINSTTGLGQRYFVLQHGDKTTPRLGRGVKFLSNGDSKFQDQKQREIHELTLDFERFGGKEVVAALIEVVFPLQAEM